MSLLAAPAAPSLAQRTAEGFAEASGATTVIDPLNTVPGVRASSSPHAWPSGLAPKGSARRASRRDDRCIGCGRHHPASGRAWPVVGRLAPLVGRPRASPSRRTRRRPRRGASPSARAPSSSQSRPARPWRSASCRCEGTAGGSERNGAHRATPPTRQVPRVSSPRPGSSSRSVIARGHRARALGHLKGAQRLTVDVQPVSARRFNLQGTPERLQPTRVRESACRSSPTGLRRRRTPSPSHSPSSPWTPPAWAGREDAPSTSSRPTASPGRVQGHNHLSASLTGCTARPREGRVRADRPSAGQPFVVPRSSL